MRISLINARWMSFPILLLVILGVSPPCSGPRDGATSPASGQEIPDTSTWYLGEPRPGTDPLLFGEGVVSTAEGMYGTVVFSPDGNEAFWVKDEDPGLFFSRFTGGHWTVPEEFPFREGYRLNSPFFSPDGEELYFLAAPQGPDGMDRDGRIWVMERSGDAWGEPRELDPRVNSVSKHFQFSLDRSRNVFFGGEGADIYLAEFSEGAYLAPVRLPSAINTTAPEMSPHISPDGDFLFFDRFYQSPPYVRIMVSFRDPRGLWGEGVDLSPYTQSEGNDSGARLSPDGRYLFFQSVREGSDPNRSVYWMEAAFIETLRADPDSSPYTATTQAPSYLGESPPGATPKPFAHQFFSQELHSSPVFFPRGDEVFWSEMEGGKIWFMKAEGRTWSEPRVAPFTLPFSGEPSFAPDGETLYFLSGHRVEESQGGYDENVWMVTRTGGGWSDPELLVSQVNDHPMHWGISVAANGTLYFGGTEGSGDVYVSELRYGRYQDPVSLGPTVNSRDMETTPEVSPDESFLVFSRVAENGRGAIDLYVSFRRQDGAWAEAVPLGPVNTSEREISPRLSPDGKYLFFLRTVDGDLRPFWVSTRVINDLRPH